MSYDQAVGMKIAPHMKLRHILEYKYGTRFFDEVLQTDESGASTVTVVLLVLIPS